MSRAVVGMGWDGMGRGLGSSEVGVWGVRAGVVRTEKEKERGVEAQQATGYLITDCLVFGTGEWLQTSLLLV